MGLLGLELCDAGILVAGDDPLRLVPTEADDSLESPGFALPDKKGVLVGRAAEQRARLYPRQVMNRFWDPLVTEPLDHPLPAAGNQAEVASVHLAQVWNRVRRFGNALVVAVPPCFQRTQLGLLLGMSQELDIPVQGFVSLPVAAAAPGPEGLHLHLDLHLHRFEASVLRAGRSLEFEEALTVGDKGLDALYRLWAQAAAAEFVRMTRFDPFHTAETEQELYRRLPSALAALRKDQTTAMAIPAGHSGYSVRLTRGMILETAKPLYDEMLSCVQDAVRRAAAPAAMISVHASHRLARLPGIMERLGQLPNTRVLELPAGAAALALPALWRELTGERRPSAGAPFFKSRPWSAAALSPAAPPPAVAAPPTHLLYRNLAYPLTANPLTVGSHPPVGARSIRIEADAGGVDPEHCSVRIQNGRVVLTDLSSSGTFLNDLRVEDPATVTIGDVIRLGDGAETILAIACASLDEA